MGGIVQPWLARILTLLAWVAERHRWPNCGFRLGDPLQAVLIGLTTRPMVALVFLEHILFENLDQV